MGPSPESLERAMQELHRRQQALHAQVQRLQALQRDVLQLEELAEHDPKARERLARVAQVMQIDVMPRKLKLVQYMQELGHEYASHTSAIAPTETAKADTQALRNVRAKVGRTFI